MKEKKFYKKKSFIIFLAVIILGSILLYAKFSKKEVVEYETVEVKMGNLIQEVSVTGKVNPVQNADLSFEISGRVAEVFVDVNDQVRAGSSLVRLNNADLMAQLRQAQAGVSSAKAQSQQYGAALKIQEAKLTELRKGTRKEEIRLYETAVSNAEKAIEDAQKSFETMEEKTKVSLAESYNGALAALQQAVLTGKSAMITFVDIQNSYSTASYQEIHQIEQLKSLAMNALFDVSDSGNWTAFAISSQTGGVFGRVQSLAMAPSDEGIDVALVDGLNALQKIKTALGGLPIKSELSTTEKTNLVTEKNNISTQITTLNNKQQLIAIQKASNENSITTAKTALNTAKNTLDSANVELSLKRAGYTREQIKAQEAAVEQAKANLTAQKATVNQAYANVQHYQAQIEKTILKSPIDGVVTRVETKVGEIIFPSSSTYEIQVPVISIINGDEFEIEANVAEVDIAKISVGNFSKVTLDAYGDDVEFQAEVIDIAPAETMIEGIATYEVTLCFTKKDERIKSGMTANLDILTAELENVVVIPQRAVISKDDDKIIRVLKEGSDPKYSDELTGSIKEVKVKTGLRSSDGHIEILEGIEEGDEIIIFIKDNKK